MDDCLILGGGVVGLSLAYELSRHDVRVHVVERGALGREASWAGAGILPPGAAPGRGSADEQLAGLSSRLHRTWASQLREATGLDTGYWPCGGLYLARNNETAAVLAAARPQCEALGIDYEQLTSEALSGAEPALAELAHSGQLQAAYYVPGEAQVRNPRHLRALTLACRQQGVRITEGCQVDDFDVRGGRVRGVHTNQGTLGAESLAVTAGAWTAALLRRFGLSTPVRPIRGQIALLRGDTAALRHVVNDGARYLVPRQDGRVLVGSTEDDVGFDKRTTVEGVSGLLRLAGELAPQLRDVELERCWAGLRPATADRRPVLGRLPGVENAFVAAGHFRAGLQLSPGTAVVMTQLMRGDKPDIDLATFCADRF